MNHAIDCVEAYMAGVAVGFMCGRLFLAAAIVAVGLLVLMVVDARTR